LLKITAKDGQLGTCPLCREQIGDTGQRCAECEAAYHDDCLLEFGGTCVTLGCRAAMPGFEAAPLELASQLDAQLEAQLAGPPTTVRGPAPASGEIQEEPAPERARPERPWRFPSLAVWVVTGSIWIVPLVLYRLATATNFFDLSFWGELIVFMIPIWVAAAFVTPMVLGLPEPVARYRGGPRDEPPE